MIPVAPPSPPDARKAHELVKSAARLRAIAANGLLFATDPYDLERYTEARALAESILAAAADVDLDAAHEMFEEPGYVTPKVDVRGAVFDAGGRLLLVRERTDGGWSLPGGWSETHESPREAVEREVLEEACVRVRATRLLAVVDRSRHPHTPSPNSVYKLVFGCELLEELPFDDSGETLEARYFAFDDLPELSLRRVAPSWIARLEPYARDPDLPPYFD